MTDRTNRTALFRLLLIVGAGLAAAVVTGVTKVVLVVAAIILMIMLHELGHFLTAKWAGMKVTEYFLGFGPRLWSIRKGETEYGVKAIPVGGYVKIVGMSNIEPVDPADEPRTYRAKPYWRRLSVAVAGSTVHMLLAFLLLYVLFTVVGTVDYDRELPQIGTISRLEEGPSPAQRAGFRVGDRLLAYDGTPFVEWDGLRTHIRARPGQTIRFEVERDGVPRTITVTPVDLSQVEVEGGGPVVEGDRPYGFVGIGPRFPVEKAGPVEAVPKTVAGIGRGVVETVKALGRIFSPDGVSRYTEELTGERGRTEIDPDTPRFLSPVGFVRVADQAANQGWRAVLVLLVSINLFVGVFNMVPLLPLDGGHVAIATYEKLRSRPGRPYRVDVRKVLPVAYAVFLVLVFIGVTSIYLDIVRPAANPFE
ncbi:MAG TPA: site-2 protease family protein [Acidimicrobiales bacterium]|nr:site-2 protease family protein [Acidimicrobiales bacterium]